MNIATHHVEVPSPQAFASHQRSPFPGAPRYGGEHSTTIDEPSVRRVWRFSQPREESYAVYRNFSCSANLRIASSNTAVWLIPRCLASLTIKSLASWLMRMLINAFCISQLYHKLRYVSSGYEQGLKPKSPEPLPSGRDLRRAKAQRSIIFFDERSISSWLHCSFSMLP
jgi:hypothetical protein